MFRGKPGYVNRQGSSLPEQAVAAAVAGHRWLGFRDVETGELPRTDKEPSGSVPLPRRP